MEINIERIGQFAFIEVLTPVTLLTELSDLLDIVDRELAAHPEQPSLAVGFTSDSYLSSMALGILIQCLELVTGKKGIFALVAPNNQIRSFLATIPGQERLVLVEDREELADLT